MIAVALSLASTLAIGAWVSHKIEEGILSRSSSIRSDYVSDFLSPMMRDLETGNQLSRESLDKLDTFLLNGALRLRIVAIKIWSEDGTVIYSSDPSMIGRQFVPDSSLVSAFSGETVSEIDKPSEESATEYNSFGSLLEIYAPIRSESTGKIVGVAEFYENGADLMDLVATAKRDSSLVTLLVVACNILAFFAIVHGGGKTIEEQRTELTQRIDELSQAMSREKALHERLEQGAQRMFEENERFLRALGSDLHDGPAQLIGLALLKLEPGGEQTEADVCGTRSVLIEAQRGLRHIAAGLLLPDLTGQTLEECIDATVRNHEAKTGTKVELVISRPPADCAKHVKECVCRFVQEGLANSFRHAGGKGQRVHVSGARGLVRVIVTDRGPGMASTAANDGSPHLGLSSLRGRLESVNGTLTVSSRPRRGTRLMARLPLGMEKPSAA